MRPELEEVDLDRRPMATEEMKTIGVETTYCPLEILQSTGKVIYQCLDSSQILFNFSTAISLLGRDEGTCKILS